MSAWGPGCSLTRGLAVKLSVTYLPGSLSDVRRSRLGCPVPGGKQARQLSMSRTSIAVSCHAHISAAWARPSRQTRGRLVSMAPGRAARVCAMASPTAASISNAPHPASRWRSSWRWHSRSGLLSNPVPDRTAPAGWYGRVGRRWLFAFWPSAPLSPSPVGGP